MPPLVPLIVAWVAGLVTAHHWLGPAQIEPLVLALLGLLPLAGALLWWQERKTRLGALCALAFLLGGLRYQVHMDQLDDSVAVARYNDRGWVTLEGMVREYPDVHDTWTGLSLETKRLEAGGQEHPVEGTVLLRAPRFSDYRYGDLLRASGRLQTPQDTEGLSYREHLARQGIYSIIWRPQIETTASGKGSQVRSALFSLKDRARQTISRLISEPEASLMQGILLGIRSGIPADLVDDFNATGTSHIIVISGANITVVATLMAAVFGRLLGKRRAYWLTLAGILFYVALVGAGSVVVRAAVMGSLYVTALYLGRRATAYVSLLASGLLLTVLNPLTLWDVGFQLSVAATLGLILFTSPIEGLLEQGLTKFVARGPNLAGRRTARYLNDVLCVTLAAQILVIPLVVYHFGRLSLVAPLANLLILPVQPPIMIVGGLATVVGLAHPLEPLARAIAWVPWLFLAYTNTVVRWMAGWPLASVTVGREPVECLVAGYGALLGALWALRHRRTEVNRRRASLASQLPTKVVVGVPLVGVVLVWLAVLQLPDGRLHVAFLDVGQGDAIFITTPLGHQILVDGGPSPSALTAALGREMPFWDRTIDLVVLTHPDADHITGLVEVLRRYRVGGWLDAGPSGSDPLYVESKKLLQDRQVPILLEKAGAQLEFGQGATLEVLPPPAELTASSDSELNNNSLVLRLIWGGASFLLTGDLEAEGEQALLNSGQPLAANVLKVGHHGSSASSTKAFLEAVGPRYAIISVGEGNRFGHPQPDVLQRLAELDNVIVLRTDEQGTVEVVSDGLRLWVRTQR